MKNKKFERNIQSAKRYAKIWKRRLSKKKNYIPHCYDGTKTLGWWDDVFFRYGSQVIAVWWVHPRTVYQDKCKEIAYNEFIKIKPEEDTSLFEAAETVYKQLGKTKKRKRAQFYRLTSSSQSICEWRNAMKEREEELLKTSDVAIRPYISIRQLDWCRGVDICLPIEVIDEESLETLADLVRDILSGRKKFEDLYPEGYTYTCDDWNHDIATLKAEGNAHIAQ
jgi:hypothetical protein